MAAKAEANAAKTARIHTNNSEHKAKLKQKTERTPSLYSGMLHGGSILVASVKRRRPTTWRAKQSGAMNVKCGRVKGLCAWAAAWLLLWSSCCMS